LHLTVTVPPLSHHSLVPSPPHKHDWSPKSKSENLFAAN
jgi:hypothetical protein